jgi:hypothetical protein
MSNRPAIWLTEQIELQPPAEDISSGANPFVSFGGYRVSAGQRWACRCWPWLTTEAGPEIADLVSPSGRQFWWLHFGTIERARIKDAIYNE